MTSADIWYADIPTQEELPRWPYAFDMFGKPLPWYVPDPRDFSYKGNMLRFCPHIKSWRPVGECSKCTQYHKHRFTPPRWKGRPYVKKPTITATPEGRRENFKDNGFVTKYPNLFEYLSEQLWEDGSDREASTLSVFLEDGMWKVALNDKALKRSCYISGDTLPEALASLEKGLKAGTADWRQWNAAKGKRKV